MTPSEAVVKPEGATHAHELYGNVYYYKRELYQHLNQVSEEWQTWFRWYFWDSKQWVLDGFYPRNLEELK